MEAGKPADAPMKESDFKKMIEAMKIQYQNLSQTGDIQKFSSLVMSWFQSDSHRLIKTLSYPLVKALTELDWSSLVGTLTADLGSQDPEIQLNALKLLYRLPLNESVDMLQSNEKDFLKILKSPEFHYERTLCLHDFLLKLYLRAYGHSDKTDIQEQVADIYMKIAEQILGSNRDIVRNTIEVFLNIYESFSSGCADLNTIDYYFDGNGPVEELLKPLVLKLTNFFLPRIETLIAKIISYEMRLRSHLITFPVVLIETCFRFSQEFLRASYPCCGSVYRQIMKKPCLLVQSDIGSTINLIELSENLIYHYIYDQILKVTFEIDVLQNSFLNIFRLLSLPTRKASLLSYHRRSKLIWDIFQHYISMIHKINYKRELNLLTINLAIESMTVSVSYKITMSLKLLEILSNDIQNILTRKFLMLICFSNLVTASSELISENKPSCLFSLFQEDWFILKLKQDDNKLHIREELLICLITVTLHCKRDMFEKRSGTSKAIYEKLVIEVLDICYRLINWQYSIKNSPNEAYSKTVLFSIDMYLLLLEDAMKLLSFEQIESIVYEIIKRVNTNEINFNAKLKSIYIICKYLPMSALRTKFDFFSLLSDFRNIITLPINNSIFSEQYISSVSNQVEIIKYISKLELIFRCLLLFTMTALPKDSQKVKENVLQLFTDFSEHLTQATKIKGALLPVLDALSETSERITNMLLTSSRESLDTDNICIPNYFLEQFNSEAGAGLKLQSDPRDMLFIAYNMFIVGVVEAPKTVLNDTIESEKPVKNLKAFYLAREPESVMNYRFCAAKLVSGVLDFVQVYVSHALFTYKSLISINVKIINVSPFIINNLRVKIFCGAFAEVFPSNTNPRILNIEDINSNASKSLTFTLLVHESDVLNVHFELISENSEDANEPLVLETTPYKIGITGLLLPNRIAALTKDMYKYILGNLRFSSNYKVKLRGNMLELATILQGKNFEVVGGKEELVLERNKAPSAADKQHTIGLLALLWDGNTLAIGVTGTPEPSVKSQIVTLDIKTSKLSVLERIKREIDSVLKEIFEEKLTPFD